MTSRQVLTTLGGTVISGIKRGRTDNRAFRKTLGVAMNSDQRPSLYDRLGGVYSIATVVDDFIDRIMTDDRLNKNAAVNEAHHRVSPPGFKYLVTEMVCWAAGGPQHYSGKPMDDAHGQLAITEDEWVSFLDDLTQSLNHFQVPQAEQDELVAIVESTKDDIVVAAPA